MGRPVKLTPEVHAAIIRALAAGVPRAPAAEGAGVSVHTLRSWCRKGRAGGDDIYAAFAEAVRKAEAEALIGSVARVRRAAQGGQVVERVTRTTTDPDGGVTTAVTEKMQFNEWTADAWWLERHHPDKFSPAAREMKRVEKELVALKKQLQQLPPPTRSTGHEPTGQ